MHVAGVKFKICGFLTLTMKGGELLASLLFARITH